MARRKKNIKKPPKGYELYFLVLSIMFIIPLAYTEKILDPTLTIRMLILGIITLLLYVFHFYSKQKPDFSFLKLPVFPILVLLIVWTAIGFTVAVNPTEGLFDLTKLILFTLIVMSISAIYLQYDNFMPLMSKASIFIAAFAVSYGLYQYFQHVPGKKGYNLFMALYEIKGLMAHKNQYASSLFLFLPFLIYAITTLNNKWRIPAAIALFGVILNIILVQTRAVWVALAIAASIMIFGLILMFVRDQIRLQKNIRKTIILIISVFVLTMIASLFVLKKTGAYKTLKHKAESIFDSDSHDNQGRLKIWRASMDMFGDHPIMGVGAGNWKIEVVQYYKYNTDIKYQNWRRPHNDYIQILTEKGLPGLILYLLVFSFIILYCIRLFFNESDKIKKVLYLSLLSTLIGYMVISFFSFPYERINHQVFIALMFSIIIGAYHKTFGSRNETINRLVMKSKLPVLIIIIGSLYYSFALFQSEYYVKIIKRYIVEKNYKGMIEYADKAFSSIITLDPISTPIHHYKGEANIKLNKKKQAYKDFQNSVKYFPGHISSLNNLAIMAYELGMEEDAFYYLDQTLDIFPKHQDALYNKSLAYYKSKDYINSYIVYLSCYNQPGKEEKYEMLERSLKMIINGDD